MTQCLYKNIDYSSFIVAWTHAAVIVLSEERVFQSTGKLTGVHHNDVRTTLRVPYYPLLTTADIVIVNQGRIFCEHRGLCGTRPQAFFVM